MKTTEQDLPRLHSMKWGEVPENFTLQLSIQMAPESAHTAKGQDFFQPHIYAGHKIEVKMKTTGVVILSPFGHQAHKQNYIALRELIKAITQSFHEKQTSKQKTKNFFAFLPK